MCFGLECVSAAGQLASGSLIEIFTRGLRSRFGRNKAAISAVGELSLRQETTYT